MNRAVKTLGIAVGLLALFAGAGWATETKDAKKPAYIGPEKCKMCHGSQYDSWKKTKMAAAMDVLKSGAAAEAKSKVGLDPQKDYTTDPKCLTCHSTGYKEGEKVVPGVTCEACHGSGSLYAFKMTPKHLVKDLEAVGLIYPGGKERCQTCHNEKSPFNEKVDPKYKLVYDKDTLTKSVHAHAVFKNDHGEIKGSLFQGKQPEKGK